MRTQPVWEPPTPWQTCLTRCEYAVIVAINSSCKNVIGLPRNPTHARSNSSEASTVQEQATAEQEYALSVHDRYPPTIGICDD